MTSTTHQGYNTQEGLQRQQEQQLEALKRNAGLKLLSVLKVQLNKKDVSNYPSSNHSKNHESSIDQQKQPEPQHRAPVLEQSKMSAKNISKDRSSSRGRNWKQNRFDKGREGQSDPEDMEHKQALSGGQEEAGTNTGNGKRQRDPPRKGAHDNTTAEDSDEELPGVKRNMTSFRE